jgi:hypothetical protein
MNRSTIFISLAGSLFAVAYAAEFQVKTLDGQTLQGEYLGTEKEIVKIKSRYGVVQIPAKDVRSMIRVGEGGVVLDKPLAPKADAAIPAAENGPVFPAVKPPDILSLLATRAADIPPPEPNKNDRQEIFRLIRNFADTNDSQRRKNIRMLQDYGRMAYPFIAAAYVQPFEINIRVDLLQALAVPNSPLTTGILMDAHHASAKEKEITASEPPLPPPEYVSKRDRNLPQTRGQNLHIDAQNVLTIEGYASVAAGPFNALFLLDVYKKRYTNETIDPLLADINRDRSRLGNAAGEVKGSRAIWTLDDRMMLIEQLVPLLFSENEDLKQLPRDLLKKILPSGYPKWDAPQSDWVEWWNKRKDVPSAWR